jgi:hypothetical protein
MENFNYAFISNKNNIENTTNINNYRCENKDKVLLNLKLKLEKLKQKQEEVKYNKQEKDKCALIDNEISKTLDEIKKISGKEIKIVSVSNKNDFLKQFDDLSYGRDTKTLGTNESSRDINSSLNRDIELKSGFSSFSKNNMNYGVVKGKMKHNNMVHFNSRRSININDLDRDNRKLENHTGNGRYWKHKKEKENLFKPTKGLSNINGMKNYSHKIVNRMNSTLYKNSERLDGIDQHVAPGLKGRQQTGLQNNARIMPMRTNELRTLNNQKESYKGVTVQSGIKGHLGKRKSQITKIKKRDFIEMKKEDFVRPEKKVLNRTLHGKPCLKDTNRTVSMSYAGSAANKNTLINSKNDFTFNESAKSSFQFKPLPASGVPKNLNNSNSFKNYENQRDTTRATFIGNPNSDKVTYNNTYQAPDPTLKEQTLHSRKAGFNAENNIYVNTMERPDVTLKEQLLHERKLGINVENNIYVNTMENPDVTLKEQLMHNRQIGVNMRTKNYNNTMQNPETTLKEQLMHNRQIGVNMGTKNYNNTLETPETTLKEQLMHNKQMGLNMQTKSYNNTLETPETTLKEQLMHHKQVGVNMRTKNYNNTLETPETTLKEQLMHNKQVGVNMRTKNYNNTLETPETTLKEQLLHNKQVGLNMNTKSYNNTLETPEITLREQLLHQKQVGINVENNNYVNTFESPEPTIKEQTMHSRKVAINIENSSYVNTFTPPDTTIKESTMVENYSGLIENMNGGNYSRSKDMEMKPTIKETTLYSHAGTIDSTNSTGYFKNKDIAKPTIKETTLSSRQGIAGSKTKTTYTNHADLPRGRLSENYEHNKHVSAAHSVNPRAVSYEAGLNATINSLNGLQLNEREEFGGREQLGAGQIEKGLFNSNRNNLDTFKGNNGHRNLNITSGTVKTFYTRDAFEYGNKNNINPHIQEGLKRNPLVNNVVFKSFIQ